MNALAKLYIIALEQQRRDLAFEVGRLTGGIWMACRWLEEKQMASKLEMMAKRGPSVIGKLEEKAGRHLDRLDKLEADGHPVLDRWGDHISVAERGVQVAEQSIAILNSNLPPEMRPLPVSPPEPPKPPAGTTTQDLAGVDAPKMLGPADAAVVAREALAPNGDISKSAAALGLTNGAVLTASPPAGPPNEPVQEQVLQAPPEPAPPPAGAIPPSTGA